MKRTAKLKRNRNIICLVIGLVIGIYLSPVQSQVVRDHRTKKVEDPFTRLKKVAQNSTVQKSKMSPVEVTTNNSHYKLTRKPEIKFVPFTLVDSKGNAIAPNKRVTLKNGKATTAQTYINELNAIEKKLNAQGYSLRNKDANIVSRMVTDTKYLDGRRALAPKSIAAFKKEADVKKIMSEEQRVKIGGTSSSGRSPTITLKPYSRYTKSEIDNLNKYKFTSRSGTVLAQKKPLQKRNFKDHRPKKIGNLSKLYELDKTDRKNWNFGDPDIFQATLEGSITRFTKIYPFDVENKDSNKSEFRVKANSKATGSLLGKSVDVLSLSSDLYAPSNVSKNMSAVILVKAMEHNVFSINKTYPQKKSFTETYAKTYDKSFPLRIPLLPGLDFKGLIGVKGLVSFELEATIERTIASVHAKPVIDLKVYGEGGLSLVGVVGGGVEAELTFVKGELDLNAYTGIFVQNMEEIVVGVNYYFGYNIEVLSGYINAYGEICSPIDIPFVDDCYRKTHQLFSWNGFKDSGTIAQGGFTPITLANIARYEEDPVFTQD